MKIDSTPRTSNTLCCFCKDSVTANEWVCKNCASLMHVDCLGENSNKCGQCRAYSSPTSRHNKSVSVVNEINAEVERQRRQRYRSFRREPESRYGMGRQRPSRPQPSMWARFKDWVSDHSKVLIIALATVFIFGAGWKYKVAYENSAVYINITIADKQIHTYHDEDGGSHTSYTIYTHAGEEFNVAGEGWNGARNLYGNIRVGKQYTALVAGLGYFNRDLIAATAKPQPKKPKPRPVNPDQLESE